MDDKSPEFEKAKPAAPELSGEDDHHDLTSELVAYLDGELDRQESEVVGTKISLDAGVRSEANALKKTWDLLDYLPRPEPSPNFTERTISKIEMALPASGSGSAVVPAKSGPSPASQPSAMTRLAGGEQSSRSHANLFVVCMGWLLALAVAGCAGYYLRGAVVAYFDRMKQQEQDAQIPSELRLLQKLHDFRYIDDLEFLEALDNPELFGEELISPMNEGPR